MLDEISTETYDSQDYKTLRDKLTANNKIYQRVIEKDTPTEHIDLFTFQGSWYRLINKPKKILIEGANYLRPKLEKILQLKKKNDNK